MSNTSSASKAAAALGRVKSPAKAAAARENGKLGGRPATLLRSRALDRFPGDTARELTAATKDQRGILWPAGTTYQPQSAGDAGGRRYQDVLILTGKDSVHATFLAD